MAIRIVECFSVSPSYGAAAEQSLPLLYFDMIWLDSRPVEILYFYHLDCSEFDFFDMTVAQLKRSLSITLKHFLPLAGKIVVPLTSAAVPVLRYTAGDSIALTIAVSDGNFSGLISNYSKTAHEFHHLVPPMSPAVYSDSEIGFSCLAIQATLFPNQGICVGFTQHHASCDATSIVGFIRAWASVNKLNSDGDLVRNDLPSCDRSRVQESTKLDTVCWARAKMSQSIQSILRVQSHRTKNTIQLIGSYPNNSALGKFRATFALNDAKIERLKNFAMMKKAAVRRVSTFVVVCAHLWSCLVKSGEEGPDDESEYLSFPVNCRGRLEPPLPENFFGNCVIFMEANTTHGRLRGEEGFVEAVKAITAAINKTVKRGRGISDYFEKEHKTLEELSGKRVVLLAGSLKIDHYSADYGWGRVIKHECIHTDFDGAIYICKGRDGGVEIGVSMPKANMDVFADIFHRELHVNTNLYIASNL